MQNQRTEITTHRSVCCPYSEQTAAARPCGAAVPRHFNRVSHARRLDYARPRRTARPAAPMLVAIRMTSRPSNGVSLAVRTASVVLPNDPPSEELGSVAPAFDAPIVGAPYAGEVAIVLSARAVAGVDRRSALRAVGERGCASGSAMAGVDCPFAVGTSSTYCCTAEVPGWAGGCPPARVTTVSAAAEQMPTATTSRNALTSLPYGVESFPAR